MCGQGRWLCAWTILALLAFQTPPARGTAITHLLQQDPSVNPHYKTLFHASQNSHSVSLKHSQTKSDEIELTKDISEIVTSGTNVPEKVIKHGGDTKRQVRSHNQGATIRRAKQGHSAGTLVTTSQSTTPGTSVEGECCYIFTESGGNHDQCLQRC